MRQQRNRSCSRVGCRRLGCNRGARRRATANWCTRGLPARYSFTWLALFILHIICLPAAAQPAQDMVARYCVSGHGDSGTTQVNCRAVRTFLQIREEFSKARKREEYITVIYKLQRVLDAGGLDGALISSIKSLQGEAKKLFKETVAADQIERTIAERKFESAAAGIATILQEASDDRTIELCRDLERRLDRQMASSYWENRWNDLRDFVVSIFPYVLLFGGILALAALIRRLNAVYGSKYAIGVIKDDCGTGLSDLIISSLLQLRKTESNSSTAGLLLLNATRVPQFPEISSPGQQAGLENLGSLNLTVGAVNVGAIVRDVALLLRWCFGTDRTIWGIVAKADGRVTAHLSARYPVRSGGSGFARFRKSISVPRCQFTVSGMVSVDCGLSGQEWLAEEVSFKMLYALSGRTGAELESANNLRLGLKQLRLYVGTDAADREASASARPSTDHLKRAIRRFKKSRRLKPSLVDAYVYEGIALDLLEEHATAIDRFRYAQKLILEQPKSSDAEANQMRERDLRIAKYNEAVAHLRNLYTVEGIRQSLELLDELLRSTTDLKATLRKEPTFALALATKADAIACWTLHPISFFRPEFISRPISTGEGHEPEVSDAEKYKAVVEESVRQVENIASELTVLLKELRSGRLPGWDDQAIAQLEWSVANALGDLYLYAYEAWVKRAKLPKDQKRSYLDLAITNFDKCVSLFPPGVEILSNLGVLYLMRRQSGDLLKSREVLEQVIKLNPNYEYAYYRLAQTYFVEARHSEAYAVVERYRSTGRPINIESFAKLVDDIGSVVATGKP